ncbi:MAG TPA: type II secretion system protein [Oceanithermus profundus]|uniref:Type II secretion system protein n=1 Tax=Oceanithermus profundus TaxID=187137 RepID=A0A7C4Z7J4_9DEIN|nr:type II secretion system protein [Oceanithermus profundus]
MNTSKGFSLIEALIATVILGVLLVAVLGPIGNLFRMSKSNQQLLDNTTLAQQTVESVLNAWKDPVRFEQACLDLTAEPLPDGVTVTVQPLDDVASPTAPAAALANCPAAAHPAPLKRVRVTASAGGPQAVVVVDVRAP